MIGISNDRLFRRLCSALGHEEWLTDQRFESNAARVRNRNELVPILEAIFLEKPRAEWMTILDGVDVPNSPVLEINEALLTPPVRESGIVREIDMDGKQLHTIGLPVSVESWERVPASPPPPMGQDTLNVLRALAGVDADQFESLRNAGVVGVDDRRS